MTRRGHRSGPALSSTAGRVLRRHVWVTAGAAALVIGLVSVGEVLAAEADVERYASATATRVATSVQTVLSRADFGSEQRSTDHATVEAALQPFIDAGILVRAKVWRVEGDQVRIVYSDERRVEGDVRPFDPELAARLDAGEAVTLPVPDDDEHRFERDYPETLREVFVGFTDVNGTPMRVELYLVVDGSAVVLESLAVHVPLLLGGMVVLSALLIPLSVRAVRRIDRLAAERQQALAYGLAASERVRRELAQRLHDGVIQDLAAVGLALGSLGDDTGDDPKSAAMLRRLAGVLSDDTDELRALAHESAPIADRSLADYLHGIDVPGADAVALHVDEPADQVPAPVSEVLWRVAGELTRNALKHARAGRIDVDLRPDGPDAFALSVSDDGIGFEPGTAEPGHLGLVLVGYAVSEAGGQIEVDTAPGAGTRVRVVVPVDGPA